MAHAALSGRTADRVAALRAGMRALEGRPEGGARLSFGVAEIDRHLPGEGLPVGALHEVEGAGADARPGAAAVLFVAGILARRGGPVLWCVTTCDLYAPALAAVGLDPARLIVAEAGGAVLAAMEEGLRHGGLAGVVGEAARLGLTASRRLSLAAEATGTPAFVLRPPAAGGVRREKTAAGQGGEPTAAATRWQVMPLPSGAPAVLAGGEEGAGRAGPRAGLGRPVWQLALTRCRNGTPGCFVVEACDDEGRLALCDRPFRVPAAPDHRARPAAVGRGAACPQGRVIAFPGGRP